MRYTPMNVRIMTNYSMDALVRSIRITSQYPSLSDIGEMSNALRELLSEYMQDRDSLVLVYEYARQVNMRCDMVHCQVGG